MLCGAAEKPQPSSPTMSFLQSLARAGSHFEMKTFRLKIETHTELYSLLRMTF